MAVNIISIERNEQKMNGKMLAVIAADAKADITDNMTFYDGATLEQGSVAFTPSLDVAVLDSSGHWTWN